MIMFLIIKIHNKKKMTFRINTLLDLFEGDSCKSIFKL